VLFLWKVAVEDIDPCLLSEESEHTVQNVSLAYEFQVSKAWITLRRQTVSREYALRFEVPICIDVLQDKANLQRRCTRSNPGKRPNVSVYVVRLGEVGRERGRAPVKPTITTSCYRISQTYFVVSSCFCGGTMASLDHSEG